jgi:mannosyltransferase
MDYSQLADLITARAAPGDCLLVNDTVTFQPAPMRPLMAARPDAYRKLVDLSLWQRATDRNDVFDTNLIPEATAGPLSDCRVVWIITEADTSRPAHEQGSMLPPAQRFGETPAFSVPNDMGSGFWSAGSSTWFRSSRQRDNPHVATRLVSSR